MKRFFNIMIAGLGVVIAAQAQSVDGDWQGTLKTSDSELRLVLHVAKGEKGSLKATLDSPDQNALGIVVSSISLQDSVLKFGIQMIDGSYEGKVNGEGTRIAGTWTQGGRSLPLEFTRIPPAAAKKRVPKPSDIDGDWQGTLDAGGQQLRIVLHLVTYEDGVTATLDSPDQNAMGLPATTVTRSGASLKFEMKQIGGSYEGTLSPELTTMDGKWTQGGGTLPLVLKRTSPLPQQKKAKGGGV